MKTITIILLSMLLSVAVFSQTDKQETVHIDVDEVKVVPPKFTGMANAFPVLELDKSKSIEEYVAENIICPKIECYNQGTEVVQFTIKPTGELSNFKVINSLSGEIDDEVIRVLKTTNGMWIPGYNNDELVAMEKEVAIIFKLTGLGYETDFYKLAKKYFIKGSKLLLIDKKPKKSLRHYNKGVQLLPNDECLLLVRGMARYESGDKEGAYRDWNRVKKLGYSYSTPYLAKLEEMSGYAELASILEVK